MSQAAAMKLAYHYGAGFDSDIMSEKLRKPKR